MIVAQVQTLVLTRLPSTSFLDTFQSMTHKTPSTFAYTSFVSDLVATCEVHSC